MEDIILIITVPDTIHRIIADSVTLKALEKSQEFYSSAFNTILAVFGIFLMIVLAPGIWNWWESKKREKELRDTKSSLSKEFEETKKQSEIQKKELQDKIKELILTQEMIWKTTGNDGEGLKLYLKKRCPNCSGANVEIIIKSKTVRKTETNYECNSDDYVKFYNRIDNFDENVFKIIALGHPLDIHYEKLDYWLPDELEHNKNNPNKIHLYLKKDFAIVLYPGKKLELVNYNEISQFIT